MSLKKWGPYVFLFGFVLALVVGLFGSSLDADTMGMVLGVLGLLGLVVGFANVSDKETVPFLIAVIALLQVSGSLFVLSDLPAMDQVLPLVQGVVAALVMFMTPAAFIVALKAIYDLAGEGAFEHVHKKVRR